MPPKSLSYLAAFTDYEQKAPVAPREAFALDRFRRLLARLGDPHLGRPTFHVAGTKGKGSTVHFADAVLRAHGARTLRYTSPHLERVNERLALDGRDLDDDAFDACVEAARPAFEAARKAGEPPTFFEALTAAAFVAGRDSGVDAFVLEVGVGGRLDATNVAEPSATAITSIDLDHVKLLGDTYDRIAAEKAGILKRGVPAFLGVGPGEPGFETLVRIAREVGAPAVRPGAGLGVARAAAGRLRDGRLGVAYAGEVESRRVADGEAPGGGAHQAVNALLAIGGAAATLRALGRDLDVATSAQAIARCPLPGRAEAFDGPPPAVVDGAHTPRSVDALCGLVAAAWPGRPVVLLAGATADRDGAALFAPARRVATRAVFVAPPTPRAADPEGLAAAWRASGGVAEIARGVDDGLELALRRATAEGGVALVVGSFYLAGAARTALRAAEAPRREPTEPRD